MCDGFDVDIFLNAIEQKDAHIADLGTIIERYKEALRKLKPETIDEQTES